MSEMSHSAMVPEAMLVWYQENGACWVEEARDGGALSMCANPEEDRLEQWEPLCVLDFKAVNLPENNLEHTAGVSFLCSPESLDEFIDALIGFRDEWKSRR